MARIGSKGRQGTAKGRPRGAKVHLKSLAKNTRWRQERAKGEAKGTPDDAQRAQGRAQEHQMAPRGAQGRPEDHIRIKDWPLLQQSWTKTLKNT